MQQVTLGIGGRKYSDFESYAVDSDLYTADATFSFDLVDPQPEAGIAEGAKVELRVNGEREMLGIVDRIFEGYGKRGRNLRIEGRDLMGLLVDSYCEEFFDAGGMSLKTLAEKLLAKFPFRELMTIEYQENVVGSLKGRAKQSPLAALFNQAQNFTKIEPGKTIFEVLKQYAQSKGLIFYSLPDGRFVFGKPKEGGTPLFNFVARRRVKRRQNNILKGVRIRDISRRYSQVTIVGQEQGLDIFPSAAEINKKWMETDPSFPFHKPFVDVDNNDWLTPERKAKMLLEKMRLEGDRLQYQVAGYGQGAGNYRLNELAQVEDEVFGISGVFLIYAGRLELGKEGACTLLKLGKPGGLR